MDEKRKSKRTKLSSRLIIKRLDARGDEEVDIEIFDVSKDGVGFNCHERLMIGAVYEAYLMIWTKEVLHAFLRIARIELLDEENFAYGARFLGMPEMESNRIKVYQTVSENMEKKGGEV